MRSLSWKLLFVSFKRYTSSSFNCPIFPFIISPTYISSDSFLSYWLSSLSSLSEFVLSFENDVTFYFLVFYLSTSLTVSVSKTLLPSLSNIVIFVNFLFLFNLLYSIFFLDTQFFSSYYHFNSSSIVLLFPSIFLFEMFPFGTNKILLVLPHFKWYDILPLKPKWMKLLEMNKLNTSLSIVAWYVTLDYEPWYFL